MSVALLAWLVLGLGVVVYCLTAGADFGAGIWHLFSRGPRATADREAIKHAIAPIWEANHVWLIFIVVLMFTIFPRAFAVISISLHVPIALALVGIVLRGAAFVFQSYDPRGGETPVWSTAFGVSSLVTPVLLGSVLGALSTGQIRYDGTRVTSGFFAGWLTPFALSTGFFAATLFALLAAVYLTAETSGDVKAGFRRRALVLELVAGVAAAMVFVLSRSGAPSLYENLAGSSLTVPLQLSTAVAALMTLFFLRYDRPALARLSVAAQVGLVVVGWGLAMGDAIVMPDVRLANAGVRPGVAGAVLVAVALGMVLLVPSLWYLFRVFKGPPLSHRPHKHP